MKSFNWICCTGGFLNYLLVVWDLLEQEPQRCLCQQLDLARINNIKELALVSQKPFIRAYSSFLKLLVSIKKPDALFSCPPNCHGFVAIAILLSPRCDLFSPLSTSFDPVLHISPIMALVGHEQYRFWIVSRIGRKMPVDRQENQLS